LATQRIAYAAERSTFGRVLAGERAATVAGVAAVGVDDDLAAGEAGVAHRAADLEPPGRVHQQPVPVGVEPEALQLGRDDVLGARPG
jgi:hypothetical protein